MRKYLLLLLIFFVTVFTGKAQRLSFSELGEMLHSSMDQAQENLFLKGYSLSAMDEEKDKSGLTYVFSNRKPGLAGKKIAKSVYPADPARCYIKYLTRESSEFERLRKQMVQWQFSRKDENEFSENSIFYNEDFEVQFSTDTTTEEYNSYIITIRSSNTAAPRPAHEKIRLRDIFRSR